MTPLGFILLLGGAAVLVIGLLRIRAPLAHIRRLDATQANLDRYDAWRGKSTAIDSEGPTGADEMRALLRRQVLGWGILSAAGAVAVLAGLLVR